MNITNNYANYYPKYTSFKGNPVTSLKKAVLRDLSTRKEIIISGQESCWKLYKPEIFEQFVNADEELKNCLDLIIKIFNEYKIPLKLEFIMKQKDKKNAVQKFYELVKTKYGIDLAIPPKVYRFVGESEIQALRNLGVVEPSRCGFRRFDVTTNPELNWNKYRIEFKPKEKFSILDKTSNMRENPGCGHDYYYHYQDSYTLDDIAEIIKLG